MPLPTLAPSAPPDARSFAERRPAARGDIEIVPLRGWRDRARFVNLPYRLHRDEPKWVAPLRRDIFRLLDRKRNPFFDHGEAQLWLAWRDGIPVGRISAQINRLHLDLHR